MNKLFYLYHDMSLHSFIRWHLEISGTAVIIKLFPWLRFTRIFPNFLYYSTFVLCWVLQCDHRFSFVSNAICTMSTLKFDRRGLCEVTRQHLCRIKVLKNFQIHFCLVMAHKWRAKQEHEGVNNIFSHFSSLVLNWDFIMNLILISDSKWIGTSVLFFNFRKFWF